MKKKSKIILGGCIVVAALTGLSVWNTWFSATKIAFVNFQTIQQGSISKANDNSFIKLSQWHGTAYCRRAASTNTAGSG